MTSALRERTPTTRPEQATAGFVLLIGLLTLLPAVSTDMYLPSLPAVAGDLATTEAGAQFTITGMLVGGALGQLLVGPFSDRVGRRRPVLIGVSLHVVISLLCLVAATITQLATLRVLAALAAVLVVVVALFLPETLPPERRIAHGFGRSLRGYADLLRDRRFLALAVIPGLGMALIMSYVAGSPFVLQQEYGLSAQQFALVFAVGGTSLVTGSQINAAVVRRVGPLRLLRFGLPLTALLAGALLAVGATHAGGIVGFVAVLWFTTAALGFVTSNASALALSRHGERAGTAAATIGFLQAGLAGAVSPLVGVLGGDAVAMTSVMLGSVVVALVVLALGTPAYHRDGWITMGADEPVVATAH